MDDGYLFFRIDPVETAVYNDTIDYEIRMIEGRRQQYGNVTITGNEKTKDYVIRRELRTIPGEKFSRADIIRTQRELSQLGFFNPEKINPECCSQCGKRNSGYQLGARRKIIRSVGTFCRLWWRYWFNRNIGVTFNNFSIKNIFKKSSWDPLPTGDGQKLSSRYQSQR